MEWSPGAIGGFFAGWVVFVFLLVLSGIVYGTYRELHRQLTDADPEATRTTAFRGTWHELRKGKGGEGGGDADPEAMRTKTPFSWHMMIR